MTLSQLDMTQSQLDITQSQNLFDMNQLDMTLISGSSSSFGVIQSPPSISLNEGGRVQISCCWNISSSGFKIKWFQYSRVLNKTHINTTIRDNCSTLSIPNAAEDDAGFYYCEVTKDIPKLLKVNGTGTHVTIQGTNGSSTCTTPPGPTAGPQEAGPLLVPMLGSVTAAALLILSICVCVTVWMKIKGCKQTERMVIREGPPSEEESPEHLEEDGQSSGGSRGSTQWYMVPVYESYFDLQRSRDQLSEKPNIDSSKHANTDTKTQQ
ncbi:uncharacterized protein LOC134312024 [Trichomycterus rosablanca]|uniref:uncharacterized protein LOC134312024 n=1 Tax=Trichomycterus rosablanca TaxID=2290929 RepID=UPI002F35F257